MSISTAINLSCLAFDGIQAGINHVEDSSPSFFNTIYDMRDYLTAINWMAILWHVIECLIDADLVLTCLQILMSSQMGVVVIVTVGGLIAIGIYFIAWHLADELNAYLNPSDLTNWHEELNLSAAILSTLAVSCKPPDSHSFVQITYIVQILFSALLMIVSAHPLLFALSIAFQLYSLVKVSELKWLQFERKFNTDTQFGEGERSFTFRYFCLLLPYSGEQDCVICQEPNPTSYFCGSHAFHDRCIAGAIYGQSQRLTQHMHYDVTHVTETNQHGVVTDEYAQYGITLPKSDLPDCALCRGKPPHNELEVEVNYSYYWSRHTYSTTTPTLTGT